MANDSENRRCVLVKHALKTADENGTNFHFVNIRNEIEVLNAIDQLEKLNSGEHHTTKESAKVSPENSDMTSSSGENDESHSESERMNFDRIIKFIGRYAHNSFLCGTDRALVGLDSSINRMYE